MVEGDGEGWERGDGPARNLLNVYRAAAPMETPQFALVYEKQITKIDTISTGVLKKTP